MLLRIWWGLPRPGKPLLKASACQVTVQQIRNTHQKRHGKSCTNTILRFVTKYLAWGHFPKTIFAERRRTEAHSFWWKPGTIWEVFGHILWWSYFSNNSPNHGNRVSDSFPWPDSASRGAKTSVFSFRTFWAYQRPPKLNMGIFVWGGMGVG